MPRPISYAVFCLKKKMLTLAFAQIAWSIAFQWDAVTGGSNGIVGVWPSGWLSDRRIFFALTLITVAVASAALVAIANAPFGRTLRAARDSSLRAAAIG